MAIGTLLVVLSAAILVDHSVAAWAVQCKAPLLDLLVAVINPIGSGVTLLITCVALAVMSRAFDRPRLHDASVLAALAFMSAGLVEFTLKVLVGRPRPDMGLAAAGIMGPSWAPGIDSFPSGHATSVFAVATVFAAYYPRLRWPLYSLAAAIAIGRVYLERHYLSDIVAGAALGIAFAVYLYRNRQRLRRRMMLDPSPDTPA
jgi:undecaprenyl-diphosphatase